MGETDTVIVCRATSPWRSAVDQLRLTTSAFVPDEGWQAVDEGMLEEPIGFTTRHASRPDPLVANQSRVDAASPT